MKWILFLLFVLGPLILQSIEQSKRKKARRRPRQMPDIEPGPEPASQRGRSLSDWIETVRAQAEAPPQQREVVVAHASFEPEPEAPEPTPEWSGPWREEDDDAALAGTVVTAERLEPRAQRARRALREGSRTELTRSRSAGGKSRITLTRGDLRSAIVVSEIMQPPLALRQETDPFDH